MDIGDERLSIIAEFEYRGTLEIVFVVKPSSEPVEANRCRLLLTPCHFRSVSDKPDHIGIFLAGHKLY